MTRECELDFEGMLSYINKYGISASLTKDGFTPSLRLVHRCYFSAITWNSELDHSRLKFLHVYVGCNNEILCRISESVSDLGSSLFNWINGNYKACRVMLRVAIENFVRAISALEVKNQLVEKNVYKMFENASDMSIFNACGSYYNCLHADYKLLCADAHTAAIQNMAHLTSLADFPAFDEKRSKEAEVIYVRVSRNITVIFCIVFNTFFHGMHHRNKENILASLTKDARPRVLTPTGESSG